MGYMVHHAIIVTSWSDKNEIEQAHELAEALGMVVTDIVASPINFYRTFLVAPDGSKEGWTDSEAGDENRDTLIAWMTEHRHGLEWVEVQYADEAGDNRIVRHYETY